MAKRVPSRYQQEARTTTLAQGPDTRECPPHHPRRMGRRGGRRGARRQVTLIGWQRLVGWLAGFIAFLADKRTLEGAQNKKVFRFENLHATFAPRGRLSYGAYIHGVHTWNTVME